jgi:hypothetical protein
MRDNHTPPVHRWGCAGIHSLSRRTAHLSGALADHSQGQVLNYHFMAVGIRFSINGRNEKENGKQKRVSAEKLKPLNIWRARQDSNL